MHYGYCPCNWLLWLGFVNWVGGGDPSKGGCKMFGAFLQPGKDIWGQFFLQNALGLPMNMSENKKTAPKKQAEIGEKVEFWVKRSVAEISQREKFLGLASIHGILTHSGISKKCMVWVPGSQFLNYSGSKWDDGLKMGYVHKNKRCHKKHFETSHPRAVIWSSKFSKGSSTSAVRNLPFKTPQPPLPYIFWTLWTSGFTWYHQIYGMPIQKLSKSRFRNVTFGWFWIISELGSSDYIYWYQRFQFLSMFWVLCLH